MDHKMKPAISLIIPAYNETDYIGRLLDSVRTAQAQFEKDRGLSVEVIVGDNASTDNTAEIARSYGAKVVHEPHRQIARARNAGASIAEAPLLVFCDADNTISSNLFTVLYDTMESEKYIGGGMLNVKLDGGGILGWIVLKLVLYGFWLFGVSVGILFTSRETFDKMGGFDEEVYVSEDARFMFTMKREAKARGLRYKHVTEALMITSARKFYQFGVLGHVRQLWRLARFSNMTKREECFVWYETRNGENLQDPNNDDQPSPSSRSTE